MSPSSKPILALAPVSRHGAGRLAFALFQGAVPAGVELCGGFEMTMSISDSIDALIEGDESAAVFDRDAGKLMLRPL